MATGSYEKFNTRRAVLSPTTPQIAWAAGIFEGEGSVGAWGGGSRRTLNVKVVQKDPWLLFKFQDLFGGAVKLVGSRGNIFYWYVSGSRARGVALTFYSYLSPRRRAQIQIGLSGETLKKRIA